MLRRHKLLAAKSAVLLGTIPLLLWAHEYGPDAGYSGVPGENGTCAQSGCHIGTANNPANRGGVAVAFPNGNTYVPGIRQHLVVTVSDPVQRAWGFQLTARTAADPRTLAGSFQSTDANTLLMCGARDLFTEKQIPYSAATAQTCPSNLPLQYMEHSLTGYSASRGKTGSYNYELDWTPPDASAGDITIYVAGNAANGDLTSAGDHIYTASYTLSPAPAGGTGGNPPSVGANAVLSAASGQPGIVPGSYVALYGSNLAPAVDNWNNSIVNGQLPTTLDGVSVTMGGKPAYVYFVSPGQINAIAPDIPPGQVQVQVTNSGAASALVTAEALPFAPAFFPWPGNYVVATHADFNWAVKPGVFPGSATIPAKPGEVIILWGTGFGATTPAVAPGTIPPATAPAVAAPVTVTVGGIAADLIYAVLSQYPGLYQVAIRVPASLPAGDYPVQATMPGAQSPNLTLTVQP